MFIYVRMNIMKHCWEMCTENDRINWYPIVNCDTGELSTKLDQDNVRGLAKIVWGGDCKDYSILMVSPLRKIEDTHGYYH